MNLLQRLGSGMFHLVSDAHAQSCIRNSVITLHEFNQLSQWYCQVQKLPIISSYQSPVAQRPQHIW